MEEPQSNSPDKVIARQAEVIENLKSKCYRLSMSNNTLLRALKDVVDMLSDKWSKEDGQ